MSTVAWREQARPEDPVASAKRRRRRFARVASGLLALLALAVALPLLTSSAPSAASSDSPFGTFAGYVWRGHVSSLRASWTVPRILAESPHGSAGTWIGAEASGGPFIQIGTNELTQATAHAPDARYVAFWSDTKQGFHPQSLFDVHSGDHLSASLTLTHDRWRLGIVDASSGAAAHFSTSDEAHASFNLAEWTQEDVRGGKARKPLPYPRLAAVGFRGLAVNSVAPSYASLYSSWMSVNGRNLAPSQLQADSFTLQPATVSSVGKQYLRIAGRENATVNAFLAQLARWNTRTSYSQVELATAKFATALRNGIKELAGARWPAHVGAMVSRLITATRVDLSQARPLALISTAALAAWRSAIAHDSLAVAHAGHMIRRTLHVPEITPVD